MMNRAGYDRRQSSNIQFKCLLNNLSDERFSEVRQTIKSLTLKTLDIELQGQNQEKEVSAVMRELQIKLPDILNNPKKLIFARQVVLHFHRRVRKNRRDRGQMDERQAKSASQQCECAAVGPRKQQLEPRVVPLTFEDPVLNRVISSSNNGTLPKSPANKTGLGPAALAPTATPPATRVGPTGISSVHRFLRNCSPSMEHLLSRFVDLGFQSPGILQVVADNWTTNERRNLLERLSPSLNGKEVTELELSALEKAFCTLGLKPVI